MMFKLRFIGSALIFVSLLTSCSSDPYANAGKCENSGESKIIEGRVAVCTGIDGKSKWYFEGKFFDETILLANARVITNELENLINTKAAENKSEMENIIKLIDKAKISINDLSKFANNDPRWDGLLEAKSKLDSEESEQSYLFRDRFEKLEAFRLGKISQREAYVAQQKQIEHLEGELSKAKNEFNAKLGVMASSISSLYSISDNKLLVDLLINYVKANN